MGCDNLGPFEVWDDNKFRQWMKDFAAKATAQQLGRLAAAMDAAAVRTMEDGVKEKIDALSEIEQATAYHYMNASGWSLERARKVRRREGVSA